MPSSQNIESCLSPINPWKNDETAIAELKKNPDAIFHFGEEYTASDLIPLIEKGGIFAGSFLSTMAQTWEKERKSPLEALQPGKPSEETATLKQSVCTKIANFFRGSKVSL